MEVRQRPRRAVDPGREQLVVDVLRLDRAEADPLDGRLVEDPPDEARPASARSGVCAPRAPRSDQPPSYVPMLIPVRTISRWPARERAADVREHDLRGEAPLRAAGPRDDAVRAEERAAVLDLDERPGPLDRRAVVGDAVTARRDRLDARQRRQRAQRPRGTARPAARSASSSARNASFVVVADQPRGRSPPPRTPPARPATEQPVTTISASGFARRARRTAGRDFSSAVAVTVQVLTRTRSAAAASPSTSGTPPRAAAAPPPPSRTG